MKDKINVAELLKDCPKGMELDCTIFDGVVFHDVVDRHFPIRVRREQGGLIELTANGCIKDKIDAKCVIFPKGKTTWEGFVPPCQFKDGDIITCTNSACSFVAIFKEKNTDKTFRRYVSLTLDDVQQFWTKESWSDFCNTRFATKEEKAKLFQAIKDNGYKWNPETKTLEKLIEHRFKVGDRIRHKCPEFRGERIITNCNDTGYFTTINDWIDVAHQDDWELVPNKFDINTLKPFDKVLVKTDVHDPIWSIDFFGMYSSKFSNFTPFMVTGGRFFQQCIPYEGNQHLLGTTDDCDEHFKTWK